MILPASGAGTHSGRRAPGFSLADRTQKQHDPQDYRGKIILLDIMSTTCPTCIQLSGVLEQVKAKYGDKVQVLSIVTLPDNIERVNKYIAENRISSPVLFDCGQVVASYLKITPQNPTVHFPHVFLIDGEGMIRNDFGHHDLQGSKMDAKAFSAEIDKLLAGTPGKKR